MGGRCSSGKVEERESDGEEQLEKGVREWQGKENGEEWTRGDNRQCVA